MKAHYLEYLADLGTTDLHPLGRYATRQLMAALDLQPEDRVLEIGCGTGGTMVQLTGQTAVHVEGIEPLSPMLAVAQKRLKISRLRGQTTLSQASGTAVPFAAATFDRVYTESVLGFQPTAAARAMLQQVWRVLKPGGRYVANEAVWRPEVTPSQAAAIYAACMADFGTCQASPQAWGRAEWLAEMQTVGFQPVTAVLLVKTLREGGKNGRWVWPGLVSDGLTQLYRTRRFFAPRLFRQNRRYRQRLEEHQSDGRWIESYLFVAEKPCP